VLAAAAAVVAATLGRVAEVARQRAEAAQADALVQRDAAMKAEAAARAAEAEALALREAAEQARRDNEQLLQDMFRAALRSFKGGTPGGEVVIDERWTPLIEQDGQRFAASTVVEGGGRIIVAGHDAVLSVTNAQGYSVFLEMTCKRLVTDRGAETGPIVILADRRDEVLKKLEQNLDTLKYAHITDPPLYHLANAAMLIVADRHVAFTDQETASIAAFLRRGGGVLAVGMGSSWLARSPAPGEPAPTLADYPMNRLLERFGARWSEREITMSERPLPALEPSSAAAPRVTLFADSKFSGPSEGFRIGAYDRVDLGRVGDDRASSVKVPPGLQVTLFEHAGFKGRTKLLTADAPDLGGFDDLGSALEVTQVQPPAAVATAFDPGLAFTRHGDACPPGSRPVTHTEALAEQQRLCASLDRWMIVRLAEGCSMDGPGHGCGVRTTLDQQVIGDILCVPGP
jgi:hypothetical protein